MATEDLIRPFVRNNADQVKVKDVAAAIVSYNTRDLLVACIESLRCEGPEELIVVDNASTDDSVEVVRSRFPDIPVVRNEQNRGYAAGVNQAFRATTTPFVLILNADTRVLPGSLKAARDHLERHPRTAVVGPLLEMPNGTAHSSYFPFPGTLAWLLENEPVVSLAALVPPLRRSLWRFTPPTQPRRVPWLLGAALLIRREAYEEVGGFDENYFMYYEEVDFTFRLRAAGWEAHFEPRAKVIHVGGASTSQRSTDMAVEHFNSTLRFYRRHYRGPRLHTWVFLMYVKLIARLVRDAGISRLHQDPEIQRKAAERMAGWRRALFDRGRSVRDG